MDLEVLCTPKSEQLLSSYLNVSLNVLRHQGEGGSEVETLKQPGD